MSAFLQADQHTEAVMLPTDDWVALSSRFTPGWPWPEDSYGLGPMYGDDGWCRGCGTPFGEQTGSLVMQGGKFSKAGVWMPNWLFDVVCVSALVADEIRGRFDVTLREVTKPRTGPTGVQQLIPVRTRDAWYQQHDLGRAVRSRHSRDSGAQTGATCARCGRGSGSRSVLAKPRYVPPRSVRALMSSLHRSRSGMA